MMQRRKDWIEATRKSREMSISHDSKRAYILARQLEAMHKSIEAAPDDVSGYPAYAASYNRFLDQAKKLFESDSAFKESISHLTACPTEMTNDILEHFGRLRADSAVLLASVFSFFDFYSPQEEKRQIGFNPSQH